MVAAEVNYIEAGPDAKSEVLPGPVGPAKKRAEEPARGTAEGAGQQGPAGEVLGQDFVVATGQQAAAVDIVEALELVVQQRGLQRQKLAADAGWPAEQQEE